MKIDNIIPKFEIIIAFLFLSFGGTDSAGRLSHRAINDVTNIETGQTGNASNEKNIDVIRDDFLKSIVIEYEMELEKELERRKSETEKDVQKVKREDSVAKVEELEDRLMQYKSYRIVREKRSPERAQLVIPDTSGDLMTQLQNNGKNFIQNIKESSTSVGLDVLRKLEALQNKLLPVGAKTDYYPDMHKENAEPSGDYVGNVTDLLNAAFSGNKNVTFIDLKYSNTERKDSPSSMKLDDHGTDSKNDNKSPKIKEIKLKDGEERNVVKSQDSDRPIHAKDDNDSDSGIRNTSSRESETGLRRKKRNAKKDELVIKTKNKTKEKNKGEEKDNNEKKGNMECNLREDKYDEAKNETINGDKDKGSKSIDTPVKEEEMNDMEDVKEGTDYEEVKSDE